jgi:hypothetical protein
MKNSLYITKSFMQWLFFKFRVSIVNTHHTFEKTIRKDFGLALLLWVLFSLLGGVAAFLLIALLLPVELLRVSMQAYIILTVTYLVAACFRAAYRSFVAERQELFDKLKQ